MTKRTLKRGTAVVSLLLATGAANAQTLMVLSDGFDRVTTPPLSPVGTPPTRDTTATAGWVSDWGANNNYAGGYVSQTYTTYNDGTQVFKVDGMNGVSGNWLNNGSPAHPLKLNNSGVTITEPIGIPGFGWVQLNHDFAADATLTASGKMRVEFDWYRTPGGNISWFFGNSQENGQNNGNAGSPALNTENDISIYWRGFQSASYGLRDNAALPSPVPGIGNYDSIAYVGSPNLSAQPISIRLDITGTSFTSGSTSDLEMWVAGVQQDLNGTADGAAYTFTWDGGGAAYMGFGSNSTPVEGTIAAPVYRASGIDNLRISVAQTVAPTWNVNASGAWSNGANWLGGVAPNGAGSVAILGAVISSAQTVTLDTAITVGQLTFDNTNSYTVSGANTLTLQATSGNAGITLAQGNHAIEAPVTLASDTVLSGPGTLKLKQLSIDTGRALDVGQRGFVVDYDGATPRASLEALVGTGYAGGTHNGPGIRSSAGSATAGVGIAEASETTFGVGGAFGGQSLDATSLVVRYTLLGDADLSGTVNIGDFSRLAANFNLPGRWSIGDFNYDTSVGIADFSLLAANFNRSVSAGLESPRGSAVPEPSSLAVVMVAAGALVLRLRRA